MQLCQYFKTHVLHAVYYYKNGATELAYKMSEATSTRRAGFGLSMMTVRLSCTVTEIRGFKDLGS